MYLIRDIDKSQDYIITVQNMDGPLKNLLVLDLTRVLVGPYCTMMLSDLGARVIKVEAPEVGDDSRKFGPFIEDYSAYFMSLNRGKESIALNLKNEDDKKIFDNILAKADILVENFKPGTLEKWGYGWKDICKKYPRLIYASASGFGQTGPLKELPAYDMVVQGMGGLMSVTGHTLSCVFTPFHSRFILKVIKVAHVAIYIFLMFSFIHFIQIFFHVSKIGLHCVNPTIAKLYTFNIIFLITNLFKEIENNIICFYLFGHLIYQLVKQAVDKV